MKHCPLNCRWCSNPESINPDFEIMTNDSRCILCGKCAQVCPRQAITVDKKRKINRLKCDLCLKCADVCPTGGITVVGQEVTVDEVMLEIMKDELLYRNSGGGVTISGGEPLSQWEFVGNLLSECKREGVHTALDTCGYASWTVLEKILRYTDLVLYDIKHMDSQSHKAGTGRDNDRILKNARLTASRVRIWLRVPVIPGYNDSAENIGNLIDLAKEIGAEKISLLPYHEWGRMKYKQLGRRYRLHIELPSDEHIKKVQKLITDAGVRATVGY